MTPTPIAEAIEYLSHVLTRGSYPDPVSLSALETLIRAATKNMGGAVDRTHVNIPISVDEAHMMALLGMNYLIENAPHLLKQPKSCDGLSQTGGVNNEK